MCLAVEVVSDVNGMNTDQGQRVPWDSHSFSEFKRDIPQQLETTDRDTNLNPD